ncbi:NAD(P)H-dependent oxidoreductase [Flammeovirga sp. EKP202]|uniref:NAD(P)H-dependent oxidoreductase n=1 Tax=Flammeovirga sp. EKP202 TaxID=2770592 RepID=UPI00165FD1F4|nr:NAD(P)H-dependent oxidoreductase [Flammeovirga sp. EKP202]MBD0402757.1 NAD(P)H-dependent oxidoreductase [Flammeovirga sp. EKP202]
MKTLMIVAHPNLDNSIANKYISSSIQDKVKEIEVREIFKLYPDYKIDIEAEHEALLKADTVIFQYPFYWYNMPAILKLWFDEVFSFNFAYGPEGDKLKGKNFLLSFTVGGPSDAYSPLGYNHFRIEDFLKPMEQSAYMAQMNYLDPIYVHGMVYVPGVYNTQEIVEQRAEKQLKSIVETLNALSNADPEQKIKDFIKEWFAQFDVLGDEGYFTNHLLKDTVLQFPEGKFIGHEGFKEWYDGIRQTIKPNNKHSVKSIVVTESNGLYNVDLNVSLEAELTSGESLNLNVKEDWKVEITRDGRVKIHEYIVKPL